METYTYEPAMPRAVVGLSARRLKIGSIKIKQLDPGAQARMYTLHRRTLM